MSDPYLQFEALEHGWRMFMHGQRRSGRTTRLIEALQDGDVVLVTDHRYGQHLQHKAKEAGKDVEICVYPPEPGRMWDNLPNLLSRTGDARVMFDHTWVECFIADRINNVGREFEDFTARLTEVRENRRKEPLVRMMKPGQYNA
jgi:hypothetical protein